MNKMDAFQPPRAEVRDVDAVSNHAPTYQPVRIWSTQGRIGRLRLLAYTVVAYLLMGITSVVLGFTLAATGGESAATAAGLLSSLPVLVFGILLGIQRSHDMGWSGWTVVGSMIPLVGLVWLFKPGTPGPNAYGPPPPPNTWGVKVLALALPVIAVVGIMVAVAVPSYQTYARRAAANQAAQTAAQPAAPTAETR